MRLVMKRCCIAVFLILLCTGGAAASRFPTTNVLSYQPEIALVVVVIGATLAMNFAQKIACMAGFVASCFLCLFDWLTSVDGVYHIMGSGDGGIVATFFPPTFATIAIAVNCLFGYFSAMFKEDRDKVFTEISSTTLAVVVVGFLIYDIVSSFLGMLSIYSGLTIDSLEAVKFATQKLGGFGMFFCVLSAGLLSLAPFLAGVFASAMRTGRES